MNLMDVFFVEENLRKQTNSIKDLHSKDPFKFAAHFFIIIESLTSAAN